MIKELISRLPVRYQQDLRKWQFRRQIIRGKFRTHEPEYNLLETLVKEGEWAIDIGANVGHYTAKLSSLVGASGRVLSFEPVPESFEVLVSNSVLLPHRNVTLLNMAVSDRSNLVGFEIPKWQSGLNNYYEARIRSDKSSIHVFCCTVDSFDFGHRISFVKIDAEGNELPILKGMRRLLERDHPILVVEAGQPNALIDYLSALEYRVKQLPQSPNLIFALEDVKIV